MPIPFNGPRNKPNLKKMAWCSMKMSYWIIISDKEEQIREFNISGNQLVQLRELFDVKNTTGMAIQCTRDRGLLTFCNGNIWRFSFGLPNRIYVTDDQNIYYSYKIEMKNLQFYEHYRKLCFENEKKYTNNVKITNIKVCVGGLGEIQEKVNTLDQYDSP
jgi:hypothetical protein